MWDYAELSKEAKVAGGPEALTEQLIQSGRDEMKPYIVEAGLIGVVIGGMITLWSLISMQRHKMKKREQQEMKQKLINEIKRYEEEDS